MLVGQDGVDNISFVFYNIETVKAMYNLTSEAHQEMLKKQNFKCAIASCPAAITIRSCVDHDHRCCPHAKSCGKCVRGILCNRHNVGLAHFQDNKQELTDAVEYLKQ